MKIKKYKNKSDKFRDKINPKYAKYVRKKKRKEVWKKEMYQKVLDTLPLRLSQRFKTYDFSKVPKKSIKSLFIYGDAGTGKTVISAYYYVEFIKQLFINNSSFNSSFYFVVTSKFIDELQQSGFDESSDLMRKYTNCDILVLDDFGVKKMTDYVYDRLYLIINERYLNNLITIINSNFSLIEIGKLFNDERIIRRIEEDYTLIKKK